MRINGEEVQKDGVLFGPFVFQRGYKIEEDPETKEKKQVPKLHAVWAQPVWDLEEFDNEFPRPVPQPEKGEVVFTKDGNKPDFEHPSYKERAALHRKRRWGYMMLKSLEPSNIQFDSVSLDDPETWDKVRDALLKEFSFHEFNQVMLLVDEANCLDSVKMEENRSDFLSRSAGLENPATSKSLEGVTSSQ